MPRDTDKPYDHDRRVNSGTWTEVTMTVNRKRVSGIVPADRRLVTFLRDDLGLTGTKVGCEVGVCGVCTVVVDGLLTSSCSALAIQARGSKVLTVEGLDAHPLAQQLQEAFIAEGGFQCGFCTSGQLVAAWWLLAERPSQATRDDEAAQHMMGNLCRCTGYYGILRALERAAE